MKRLDAALAQKGIDTFRTNEPTDNFIGRIVRAVLQKKEATTPNALAMLYAADREDHLNNAEYGLIRQSQMGKYIICDRYFYSSFAYQGVNCNVSFLEDINAGFPAPEVIIYIDTPVSECLRRIEKRGQAKELFEIQDYLTLVKTGYEKAFDSLPEGVHFLRIDGTLTPEEIESRVQAFIAPYLPL